ncbi:methyl-accepting chemotaxis protein [Lyngbya aestuarii]|uniref:methyl-accepting chemotaxis protein n=1 Tax=Lyngbya aestuarii TaxID=118322 RepID=UPI00403E053C
MTEQPKRVFPIAPNTLSETTQQFPKSFYSQFQKREFPVTKTAAFGEADDAESFKIQLRPGLTLVIHGQIANWADASLVQQSSSALGKTNSEIISQNSITHSPQSFLLGVSPSTSISPSPGTSFFRQFPQKMKTIWQQQSLSTKATVLAIALGTLPVIGIIATESISNSPPPQLVPGETTPTGQDQTATLSDFQKLLLLTLKLSAGGAALLLSAMAIRIAHRNSSSILVAAKAAEQLSQGQLNTRILVEGEDELSVLGTKINQLAGRLVLQAAEGNQAQQLHQVTSRIRASLEREYIINTAVTETRLALQADRVIIYRFDDAGEGTIIAESIALGWPASLGSQIREPAFKNKETIHYQKDHCQAIEDIYTTSLTESEIRQLELLCVKASLVVPIIADKQSHGLLIAHQCSETRDWKQLEVDFFKQVATQIGFALDQVTSLEELEDQRKQQEAQAKRAFTRAKVTQQEALKQRQLKEAVQQEALKQRQLKEAAQQEALKQRQLKEAAQQEALKQRQLKEAVQQEALKQRQLKEAAQQEALKQRQLKEAAHQEALKQRQFRERQQQQLAKLLKDIEAFAQGDLRARASVTEGEIGRIADSFNGIMARQQAIAVKIKQVVAEANTALQKNQEAVRQISSESSQQSQETSLNLNTIEQIQHSIQELAQSVSQATSLLNYASSSAEAGSLAMDTALQNIWNLEKTVANTFTDMQGLGKSAQEACHMVSLIKEIALETNMLAIDTGVEAARMGEDSEGFAVVAKEFGELTSRSSLVIQQIEKLVNNIQQETAQLVKAMHQEMNTVNESSRLVKQTKQSMGEIFEASYQADKLVESIALATISPVETSRNFIDWMKSMAQVSEETSKAAEQISGSIEQTITVTQELETSIEVWKVKN